MESFKAGKGPTGGSSGRQHRAVATPTDGGFSGELLVVVFVLTIGWAYMRGWFSDGAGSSRAATRTGSETSLQRWKPKPREPFKTLQEVEAAIRQQGLESCSLMVAVDFTKSNEWMGRRSYGNRCLHDTAAPESPNPYQRVISIIGKTLAHFDDDGIIPAFGFGDTVTRATGCFPFYPDRDCVGLEEVLERYTEIAQSIQMSGPTNFAPAIREAVKRVQKEDNAFHVLLIIADGQVDRERETAEAIVAASSHPLAIVCVGVGDGPWDQMHKFDDELPSRRFDNFQFVELNGIEAECTASGLPLEAQFALAALMELPAQFKFVKENGML